MKDKKTDFLRKATCDSGMRHASSTCKRARFTVTSPHGRKNSGLGLAPNEPKGKIFRGSEAVSPTGNDRPAGLLPA
jgi:hypothetical protein